MSALNFITEAAYNAIFIFDCLRSTEMQTARRLEEDLKDLEHGLDTSNICRWDIGNREEFISALDEINEYCLKGLKPIIHIECHGDIAKGISIGNQQEIISWYDLCEKLRQINISCNNNLGVVMAGCYGLYAISKIRHDKPCPFFFLVGTQHLVSAGDLLSQMKKFYEALFVRGSLTFAMRQLDSRFESFLAERVFCISFARYCRKFCMGKGLRDRVDRLITEMINEGRIQKRDISSTRKNFKSWAKPNEAAFRKFAGIFLHGRYNLRWKECRALIYGTREVN